MTTPYENVAHTEPSRGCTLTVVNALGADNNATVAAATGLRFMGFSVRCSTAGRMVIMHGATVGGGVNMVHIEALINTNQNGWFGPDGISIPNGISLDWVTPGVFDVSLYTKVVL